MKTKIWTALLLTIAFAGFRPADAASSIAPPQTEPMKAASAAQSELFRKLYARGDAAALRRDVVFLSATSTNGCMFFFKSGRVLEKPRYMALLKQTMKRVVKFNAVQTRLKLVQQATRNVVFVTSTSRIDMIYRGLDEKIHRSISVSQTRDSWLLTEQGWRIQNSQEVETRSTVDGRPHVA